MATDEKAVTAAAALEAAHQRERLRLQVIWSEERWYGEATVPRSRPRAQVTAYWAPAHGVGWIDFGFWWGGKLTGSEPRKTKRLLVDWKGMALPAIVRQVIAHADGWFEETKVEAERELAVTALAGQSTGVTLPSPSGAGRYFTVPLAGTEVASAPPGSWHEAVQGVPATLAGGAGWASDEPGDWMSDPCDDVTEPEVGR